MYTVADVRVMSVAARVFAPEIAIFGTGDTAMDSENVAVMVSDAPDLTGFAVE